MNSSSFIRPRKSFEEHVHYLHEAVKVQLFFLWTWLHRHPGESFVVALRSRVDIYRKTDINEGFANHKVRRFDDPRWREIEGVLGEAYWRYTDDLEATAFEAEAFRIVRPLVDARCLRDYREPPEAIAFGYKCGSLDYDPPLAHNSRRVFLHIANAIQPASIFDNPRYLADCLTAVICQCRERFEADSLETATWLNSYPRWLAYFPDEWHQHMGPEEKNIDPGFGYWGQLLTARGTFNEKVARHIRVTGDLPYWPRKSWCTFASLEQWLLRLGG